MLPGYRIPNPLEYFAILVASDEQFPVLEAAASLAMDEYPELDVEQVLGTIDQLAARLKRQLADTTDPVRRFDRLNRFFYRDLGFSGNHNHYHDPENSYLHTVLRTRRGIPVSLAVLWLELAHGIGLKAQGVGFPGHFLISLQLPSGSVILDPLTGEMPSLDALAERLEAVRPNALGAKGEGGALDRYLRAATPRSIVARMLLNLKEIHRAQEDWSRMLATQNRLIVLLPHAWEEYRDRGLVHAELGDIVSALPDLETYLRHAGVQPDRAAIEARLADLRGARPD